MDGCSAEGPGSVDGDGCGYTGVVCDGTGSVTHLALSSLTGTIPADLANYSGTLEGAQLSPCTIAVCYAWNGGKTHPKYNPTHVPVGGTRHSYLGVMDAGVIQRV